MSKSREAFDEQQPSASQADAPTPDRSPTPDERRTAYGGQANYGIGRESRSDFPRHSTSNRGRRDVEPQTPRYQSRYQSQNEPYATTPYNRQQPYQQRQEGVNQGLRQRRRQEGGDDYGRSQASRADSYQNRQWTDEDSGDFYSRSIRERQRRDEYADSYGDRHQSRGSYRGAEQRDEQGYQDYRQNYRDDDRRYGQMDNEYERRGAFRGNRRDAAERREYGRDFGQTERQSQGQSRLGYAAPTPFYGNEESHFGTEPWFDRQTQAYAYRVRCRDLMTRDVTSCAPETSLRDVAEMMESENVGSIPVVENGRLLGLVTDRDIVCRVIAEGRDTRTTMAREAMSEDLVTCLPEETVIDAIHKMGENQVRRIPVCDPTGRLRGILSMGDVALEAERDFEVAQALEQVSQPNRSAGRRRW